MSTLPCHYEERVVKQIAPAVDLLQNLDDLHPDVLVQHGIEPQDYKSGFVFRSAVEQIRGTFIASSTAGRQRFVANVLDKLLQTQRIHGFEPTFSSKRVDFELVLSDNPRRTAGLDVKGGEGNSINISERSLLMDEFGLWCHLDGAIVHQPARSAHAIVNRITNEMVNRRKVVDMLFIRDVLCGTPARPCPKYPGKEATIGAATAPDVFLFPQRVPTPDEPEPPVHTLQSVMLPQLVLDLFGVAPDEREKHVWYVHLKLQKNKAGALQRHTRIIHRGVVVDESPRTNKRLPDTP